MPFNIATHRVFGDDVHLVPLCQRKQRTELIELATARQWAIRTEREIIGDITNKFSNITQAELMKMRL